MEILFTNNKLCRHCYACVRVCPVNAISFQHGKITTLQQDCVLCGNCTKVCTANAILTFDDTAAVKKWLAEGEQLTAILDPSFVASFHCQPRQLISGLRRLGFSRVLEAAFGAGIYAAEYQKLLKSKQQQPIISSHCPAVVALVEKHFPNLINCLAPVQSPMMLTGQWAKKLYPTYKTVFIGPCLAKKTEVLNATANTAIDALISFKQLKQWVPENCGMSPSIILEDLPAGSWDSPDPGQARLLPLPGGLLEMLGLQPKASSIKIITAHSPVKCLNILRSISWGLLDPVVVNLFYCNDGCINGSQIANPDSCFEKTQKVIAYTKNKPDHQTSTTTGSDTDRQKQKNDRLITNLATKRSFVNQQRPKRLFSEEQVWQTLQQIGKNSEKDLTNCGACGYGSCREYAVAVLRDRAEPQMCLPFLLKQHQTHNANLATMLLYSKSLERQAITDGLTGLYNHRRFQETLDRQITTSQKTKEPFALFLIDIDYFKKINDLYGHQAGDAVLVELACLLQDFFSSSFVARYGGEEFIAIVPQVTAAKALAIGNNLVKRVQTHSFSIPIISSTINLTVSAGIACYPLNALDKDSLLKLVDHALYNAKETKNRAVLYSSVLDDLITGKSDYQERAINTVKTLNIVLNAKDNYTYNHSQRVMQYTETLARQLALPEKEIKYLKYGAYLHDIGKINIDMAILLKSGKLTTAEYEIIKQHPATGAGIVEKIVALHNSITLATIAYHHERYDGQGYPAG
ncbi:diguanylate cyclase, partial [Peptococcaceae bacterium]|nr:diguanylate cyclase [Peptococcaceae bacterium]